MHNDYLERMQRFGSLRLGVFNLTRDYSGLSVDGSLNTLYFNDKKIIELYFDQIAKVKPLEKTEVVNDITSRLVKLGFCIVN